jgi:hypothetical protein
VQVKLPVKGLDTGALVGSEEAATMFDKSPTVDKPPMVIVVLATLPVELELLDALVVTVAGKVPVVVGVPVTSQVTVWLAGILDGRVHAKPDGVIVHCETTKPAGRLVMSQLAVGASPVALGVEVLAQVKLPV